MATSNSSLTPVDRDTDFAAELLLNRVMNGQLETSSGKTINAASRLMATRHDATAFNLGAVAENVAVGKTIVQGTEDALTELVNHVKKIRDIFSVDDQAVRNQDLASTFKDQLDALLATEVQGVAVLLGSNDAPNGGGLDLTLGVHSNNETINIGNADVKNANSAFKNLYDHLSAANFSTIEDDCEKAITELYDAIAHQGVQYNILDNRYVMLNDLASSYHEASDEQAVNMGGSMRVLNAFS